MVSMAFISMTKCITKLILNKIPLKSVYVLPEPPLERNVLRLVFSVGVIIFACFIVIFDIKTRQDKTTPNKFTSSVKVKDRNDAQI